MSSSTLSRPVSWDYLGQRHFFLILLLALLIHVVAVAAWQLMPGTQIIDVPVRMLNIKLGDDDVPQDAPPPADNNSAVENTLSNVVHDSAPEEQARAQSMASSIDKAMTAPDKDALTIPPTDKATPKQFVRDSKKSVVHAPGSALGNTSGHEAELVARYEQTISLWIQKFKLYPQEARAQSMHGGTVVRVRIDRRGNVHYYALERSTGYQLLDQAAIDMVRRANPVPAVPAGYPSGNLFEFLIPVNFYLK